MQPAVEIRDLDVTFATDGGDVHAVRGVSLEVRRGEVLAIVGESGSGKTVTARTILGPRCPRPRTSGRRRSSDGTTTSVSISASRMRELRGTRAAMIFQEPSTALNPVFTVGWQLAEGLRAHGKYSKAEARRRGDRDARPVGIPDAGAPRQRLPAPVLGRPEAAHRDRDGARARPDVIIADEPTTALDVTVQAEILELLRDLRDEYGTAIVLITHNMGVVADLADRVAVMYNGEIVETAPVRELFASPQHRTPRGCSPPCRASRSPTDRRSKPSSDAPVVVGQGPGDRVPGPSRPQGVPRRRRRELHDRARRGAGPRRRERIGQDHDRPRDRRPHPGHRRLAATCSGTRCSA